MFKEPLKEHIISDATFDFAKNNAKKLLQGHVCFFSHFIDQVPQVKQSSTVIAVAKIVPDFRDLFILTLLHGSIFTVI